MDVVCLRPEADFARVGALPPASLKVVYRMPDACDLGKMVRQARALVIPAVGPRIAPALFEGSSLQLVQVTGAGLDRLDEATLKRLRIAVANVPAASNHAVAEYVVAAAVMLLRRLCWADSEIRKGSYGPCRESLVAANFNGLEGLLAGVVGLGTIGMAVAAAFHKMGCRVCYYDPAPRDRSAAERLDARPVSLRELLETADVVSLHVPLLPETRGMIGERQLASMKPGAVLVQASRGGVVDEVALAGHLRSGHLGGAAVDVYSNEPPAADNPLLALAAEGSDRIWLTPHVAGVTRQASEVLFRTAWSNVERVLIAGQPPLNRVY
ncbi:MAG TPA: NAD(P)-dependent oxidoreductase [Terriglobales bacterium]|nr:NAD(P)-dependent oxidoreductase [Terriglobales bacterium]